MVTPPLWRRSTRRHAAALRLRTVARTSARRPGRPGSGGGGGGFRFRVAAAGGRRGRARAVGARRGRGRRIPLDSAPSLQIQHPPNSGGPEFGGKPGPVSPPFLPQWPLQEEEEEEEEEEEKKEWRRRGGYWSPPKNP